MGRTCSSTLLGRVIDKSNCGFLPALYAALPIMTMHSAWRATEMVIYIGTLPSACAHRWIWSPVDSLYEEVREQPNLLRGDSLDGYVSYVSRAGSDLSSALTVAEVRHVVFRNPRLSIIDYRLI